MSATGIGLLLLPFLSGEGEKSWRRRPIAVLTILLVATTLAYPPGDQGGGNMPAYGKNLSPAETPALVAFLETLHPVGQTPGHNAALNHGGSKN